MRAVRSRAIRVPAAGRTRVARSVAHRRAADDLGAVGAGASARATPGGLPGTCIATVSACVASRGGGGNPVRGWRGGWAALGGAAVAVGRREGDEHRLVIR